MRTNDKNDTVTATLLLCQLQSQHGKGCDIQTLLPPATDKVSTQSGRPCLEVRDATPQVVLRAKEKR